MIQLFYFLKFHSSLYYMFQDHIYAAIDLNCYKFMDHRSELSDAITQIINALSAIQTASQENQYSLPVVYRRGVLERVERVERFAPPMTSSLLNLFRLALIYVSLFDILEWLLFVYLMICTSFLTILIITTAVFSHSFAGCRLCIVCVYRFQCIFCF